VRQPLKHRWSLLHNYLAGITAGDWWRLLRENRFAVDPVYWHRAAFISMVSLNNSWHRRIETRRYGPLIEKVSLPEPPLFILGHWRQGTTHLHNLLAQDDRFAFANTYQVVNPHTFLTTEEVHARRFAFLLPPRRPMDNMDLSFQTPQEDEFAPAILSRRSLYLGMSFPRREDFYHRYLTFRQASESEIAEWKGALLWFLKKLTFKFQRPLVLKSPPHTARVRLLLELFPGAKFVHIRRHPYAVFQSCLNFFDTAAWYTYLQRPDSSGLEDRILQRYRILYDAYFEDTPSIPSGRLHEMSFEELERDPVGQLRLLYEALHLPRFEEALPKIKRYTDSLTHYQKNRFPPLAPDRKSRVAFEWARTFEAWKYDL
jgi:omega-hydroxy-beta-dihydromenaquinone-9 sulfotransferase